LEIFQLPLTRYIFQSILTSGGNGGGEGEGIGTWRLNLFRDQMQKNNEKAVNSNGKGVLG
jgi:hypothetical protein